MPSRRDKLSAQAGATPVHLMRTLPSVDQCLKVAVLDAELREFGHEYLKALARTAQDQLREAIAANTLQFEPSRENIVNHIVGRMRTLAEANEPTLRDVINATGVVLHTNLGRALLAETAIDAVVSAARCAVNIEYDLETGSRGERDTLVEPELQELTGAEAATIVNNNAAAVLLALNSLAEGREVIVSRGELIEIGGSFRLPDVMMRSGARLREVGTTNRTHRRDYEDAIGPETGLLLKVHPSNYRVIGFTSEVSIAELAELGRARGVEVMEDLGAGALVDLSRYGLPREPLVGERIAAGAGLVTFSGDKLLGGPQAGIIVGRRSLIDRLRANPLKRALRCDKLTLAALQATLRLYLRGDVANALPTLRILRRDAVEIARVAERAREVLLEQIGGEFELEVVDATSEVGSGSLPVHQLKSHALRITHPAMTPEAISTMFRRARPPIIGHITGGAFHLDLRTIEDPRRLAADFSRHTR